MLSLHPRDEMGDDAVYSCQNMYIVGNIDKMLCLCYMEYKLNNSYLLALIAFGLGGYCTLMQTLN